MTYVDGNATYDLGGSDGTGWRKPSIPLFQRMINISPTDYVFFHHTDNVKTNNVKTEWQYRRLPARGYSSYTRYEGADFAYRAARQPTRVSNTAHILWIGVELTETAMAESHYGAPNLWNDQINDAAEVLKGSTENALIRSTETAADESNERMMDGLLASITTSASSFANTSLSETQFKDGLKLVWDKGPRARDVLLNASLQNVVDQFDAQGGTKQVFTTDEGITNMVTFYRTAFGVVRNHLCRDLVDTTSGAEIVFIDFRHYHKAWLRKPAMKMVPSTADAMRGVIVQELTLKYDDETAAAKYTAIKHT